MKKTLLVSIALIGFAVVANAQTPWTGEKTWYWSPTSVNTGAVWGNGGYMAGPQDGTSTINGAWWGCGTEDNENCLDKFAAQYQHAGGQYDKYKGDCYNNSHMVMNADDGTIVNYSNTNEVICSGTFSISDYNQNEITDESKYSRGTLTTTEGTILWPFAINQGGATPSSFEIGYLDANRMILVVPDPGAGAWGECTWWSFGTENPDPSAVGSIMSEKPQQPAEYFTIDGLKVENPSHGHYYVRKQNGKAKLIFY